jgi:hypothetical protein
MNAEWSWQAAAITAPFGQAGRVGVNHDQPSQATMLYIHRLDSTNVDRGGHFERMGRLATIHLQTKTQASSWHRYRASGRPILDKNGECWVIPVMQHAGSPQGSEPPNATPVIVSVQGDL